MAKLEKDAQAWWNSLSEAEQKNKTRNIPTKGIKVSQSTIVKLYGQHLKKEIADKNNIKINSQRRNKKYGKPRPQRNK